MPINHAKEYLIFVHIGVVFLHFLARASNGCQYSNFENKCPKLGTGTPEDMVLTNLGDSLDSDPSGFVLLQILIMYWTSIFAQTASDSFKHCTTITTQHR